MIAEEDIRDGTCKICLDDNTNQILIYPCLCTLGVHADCFIDWVSAKHKMKNYEVRTKINDTKCEVCLSKISFKIKINDDYEKIDMTHFFNAIEPSENELLEIACVRTPSNDNNNNRNNNNRNTTTNELINNLIEEQLRRHVRTSTLILEPSISSSSSLTSSQLLSNELTEQTIDDNDGQNTNRHGFISSLLQKMLKKR
jgi:hypothetical protein